MVTKKNIVTKLKNSNCDRTQKLSSNSTSSDSSISDSSNSDIFSKNNLTP